MQQTPTRVERWSSGGTWFRAAALMTTAAVAAVIVALLNLLRDEEEFDVVEGLCAPRDSDGVLETSPAPDWLNDNNPARHYPLRGADYQRAFALPGGCVLWVFQDAYIATPDDEIRLVHNAGTIQRPDGTMTTMLSGDDESPRAWLLPDETDPRDRWYWPLDGELRDDVTFQLLVAEMSQPDDGYLSAGTVEPTGVLVVTIDIETGEVRSTRTAPQNMHGKDLYGWSVTSDDDWTYLYSHCYRQFGHEPLGQHDLTCAADVKVARVPLGEVAADPDRWEFWDGESWQADPSRAVPVIPSGDDRQVNPTDVVHVDGTFYAITKEGDWYGDDLFIDVADEPHGPFRTVWTQSVDPPESRHGNPTNTYYASWTPWLSDDGYLTFGLSSNTWDRPQDLANVYNPTFFESPVRVRDD